MLSRFGNVHIGALESAGASQVVAAEMGAAKVVLDKILHLHVMPEEQM